MDSGAAYRRLEPFGSVHSETIAFGGLAQLARAPALQAGGQRFESVILHSGKGLRSGSTRTLTCWKQSRREIDATSKSKKNQFHSVSLSEKHKEIEQSQDVTKAIFSRNTERRKGHMKDALALGGDEGRDKLR